MEFFRSSYTMDSVYDGKRVVSFFIWDPELEKKIDREIKMIDGISKLLKVASDHAQIIECHKALILSQQRMLAFMAEIQRKQKNLLQKDRHQIEPSKAMLTLSNIQIPLNWTNFKAKTDQKKFAVFCLIRIGCEIIDTSLCLIDKSSREVSFRDRIIFENVGHDFEMILEIYALNRSLELSPSAQEFADRYSYYSVHGSPTLSRKLVDSSTNQQKTSNTPQSKFILIARTIFTKQSVNPKPIEQILFIERTPDNPLMKLPIEKKIIARFLTQPNYCARLSNFTGVVRIGTSRYICSLTQGFFNGEQVMDDDFSDQHRFSIPITNTTLILSNYDDLSFTIFNRGFGSENFLVQDFANLDMWVQTLQQHIVDIQTWQQTTEHLPQVKRYSQQGHGSLGASSLDDGISNRRISLRSRAKSFDNLDIFQHSPTQFHTVTNLDNVTIPSMTTGAQDNVSVYRTRL